VTVSAAPPQPCHRVSWRVAQSLVPRACADAPRPAGPAGGRAGRGV